MFRRIRSQREFDTVYKHADRTWHTPWFVLFYRRGDEPKAAFVAGKKVGNAVRRNRAKRLLRAHFHRFRSRLLPGSYIFVAKAPLIESDFEEVRQAMQQALQRCKALR